MSSHIFSLYAPLFFVSLPAQGKQIVIDDATLVHRMSKVLRFAVHDSLILFDRHHHAKVQIIEISKKNIIVLIQSINKNYQPTQKITFLLPLLKRDALELAVYSLCELGIDTIQLLITERSRKNLINSKEFDRLSAIVIAAAEQSKNYAISQLLQPKTIDGVLQQSTYDQKIVFDVSGKSALSLIKDQTNKSESVVLLVGPEAGLTDVELQLVQKNKFELCALTHTTLRAVQAVALGAGLFRVR